MSFISVEPQSRVLLESHSNTLLAQYDAQLRIIADRYLAFFQERRSIEATYTNSLRKLYHKAKTVDASFDARAEPTTTRAAWDTVRDSLRKEASIQQTFVDILDNDVIKPLQTLKETKYETRERLQDDLKRSAAEYADHAENKIAKLQEAYLRKYLPQPYAYSTRVSRLDVPGKRVGGKMSALFRDRREDLQGPFAKPSPPEEVSDDDCRSAITSLNGHRLRRDEILQDEYDCLEKLVFTPTVKDILVKYMDACAKYDSLSKSTMAEVQTIVARTDTSNLIAYFRRALSSSIPPLTLYRNYRPGAYSDLIFGVPLVELETNKDNISRVMGMCIEEVEKRGLYIKKIYSSDYTYGAEMRELRRRIESEKSFSFSSSDNIYAVALLLQRYLWDLPEPLFTLTLQEYRQYIQNRARNSDNDYPLLRSKIRELHPVHRAALEALLRHLLRVASHSDKNGTDAEWLNAQFRNSVLRGNEVIQDGVDVKSLVLEDLIQNVHTLFDERPSLSRPVPSPHVAETMSTDTYGSLFLSLELPQSAEVQATASTTRYRPGFVDSISASTRSSFSSFPSDAAAEGRLTPPLSPLLGFSSSKTRTLTEGVEMAAQEQVISKAKSTKVVATLGKSTPPDVVSLPAPTSAAERQSHQSRSSPHPAALTSPQSLPESVLSSTSDFSLSSATSLQTGTGRFSL